MCMFMCIFVYVYVYVSVHVCVCVCQISSTEIDQLTLNGSPIELLHNAKVLGLHFQKGLK